MVYHWQAIEGPDYCLEKCGNRYFAEPSLCIILMSGEIASDYRHRAREDDRSFWALVLISSVGLIKLMVMTLMTAVRRERREGGGDSGYHCWHVPLF